MHCHVRRGHLYRYTVINSLNLFRLSHRSEGTPLSLARSLELLVNVLHNRGPNGRLLARSQLSHAQFLQLRYLLWNPGSTVGEMADALGISRPAATQSVDRLVARGLVQRMGDVEDRRRVHLRLTAKGEAVTRRTLADMERELAAVVEKMSAEDREALTRGIDAFLINALTDEALLESVCVGCVHQGDPDCPVNVASLRLTGQPVRCLLPEEAAAHSGRRVVGE